MVTTEAIIDATDRLEINYTADYVEIGSADKIVVSELQNKPKLGANDSLVVTPYQSATSVDYRIPQSVVQGILDVQAIRDDLMARLNGLDIALFEAKQYLDTTYNNIRQQVYTDLDVRYLANADVQDIVSNAILTTDLTNMRVVTEYNNGAPAVTITLGELKDRYLTVANNYAGYTQQLDAAVDNSSAAVTATSVLRAKVDGLETRLVTEEGVSAGTPVVYSIDGVIQTDDITGELLVLKIGMTKSVGEVNYVFLGGTLGENGDGWLKTDDIDGTAISSLDTSLNTLVNTQISLLQSQIDGEVTSWFYPYMPAQDKYPWNEWISIDTTNGDEVTQTQHLGDLFYDLEEAIAYRFAKSGAVYGWNPISDDIIIRALTDASNAQSTANGKNTIYYKTEAEINAMTFTADDIGDTWVNSDTGITKVMTSTGWQLITTQSAIDAQTAANRTVAVTSGTLAPTAVANPKDIYVRTDAWYPNKITSGDIEAVKTALVVNPTTSVVVGRLYNPIALGSTTLTQWKALFSGLTAVPTINQDITATATGVLAGGATVLGTKQWGNAVYERQSNNTWQLLHNGDQTAIKWAGGASKLLHGPDGSITGWSFGNGSGVQSEFKINADKFVISDSTNTHQPFTIDTTTGLSKFNGVVSFTNTDMSGYDNSNIDTSDLAKADMSNVTTIDGGKITTGSIDATKLNVNSIFAQNITVNSGKITAANGSMVIDFLNGSIYIA